MNIKTKQTIISFCTGVLVGIILLFNDEFPVEIEITTEQFPWAQIFISYLLSTISIPLLVGLLNVIPESTINIKHIFNAKYFFMVSIFILGTGVALTPGLFINDYNIIGILFIFCFGTSIFIGSLIANKLFGGLS